jgi:Icc-related predicted phosphoesterase
MLKAKNAVVAENSDIVITHYPPKGHGGKMLKHAVGEVDAGCATLRKIILERKPLIHLFGHIHEGYGITTEDGIWFVNASTLQKGFQKTGPWNPPIVFDVVISSSKKLISFVQ